MNTLVRVGLWIIVVPLFFVMAGITLILIKIIEVYMSLRRRGQSAGGAPGVAGSAPDEK